MADVKNCPLCDTGGVPRRSFGEFDAYSVDCPTCGSFVITREALVNLRRVHEDRWRISAIAREMSARERQLLLADGQIAPQVEVNETVQVSEILGSRFPRTIADVLDRTLLNLARISKHPGTELDFDYVEAYPVFFARNNVEAGFVGEALTEANFVRTLFPKLSDMRAQFTGLITAAGWNQVAELQAARTGEPSTQAFVAMWFGNDKDQVGDHSSAEFCTTAFLEGFKRGINNAGYSELRVDFKEFNDDIMDEIITGIRRSKFIVADFTGNRPGVYYEAGFARGLGIPVIFTCHKDHIEKAHFDTNHMNHLTWSTFGELANKLEKRIVATIGQGPLAPPQAAKRP